MKGEREVGGAHGRRGPGQAGPGQKGPAQVGWALLVIAMALIGGLAAATLVDASLLIAVVVSVVIGAIGAVVVLRSPAREPGLTSSRTATIPRSRPRRDPSSPAPPGRPAPPTQAYPVDPVAAGLNPDGAPAPDLSTYLASTFIAQCPRCGAFRLDIRRGRSGWDFRCEACENTWTWQPGTPWPPVRVMPP